MQRFPSSLDTLPCFSEIVNHLDYKDKCNLKLASKKTREVVSSTTQSLTITWNYEPPTHTIDRNHVRKLTVSKNGLICLKEATRISGFIVDMGLTNLHTLKLNSVRLDDESFLRMTEVISGMNKLKNLSFHDFFYGLKNFDTIRTFAQHISNLDLESFSMDEFPGCLLIHSETVTHEAGFTYTSTTSNEYGDQNAHIPVINNMLGGMTSLQHLSLSSCHLTKEVSLPTSIVHLKLDGNYFSSGCIDFKPFIHIKSLSLRSCELTSIPPIPSTLEVLDLSHNHINYTGIETMAESGSLTHLDLSSNKYIYSRGIVALSKCLNTNLTSLSIRECSLGAQGFVELLESLKTNESLTRLDVSRNNIGSGSSALLTFESSTLVHLKIHGTRLPLDSRLRDFVNPSFDIQDVLYDDGYFFPRSEETFEDVVVGEEDGVVGEEEDI